MAKWRRRALPAALALALLGLAAPSRADWEFTPQFELRETYTDNVAQRPEARANWVTEATPGFVLKRNGPRLQLNLSYDRSFYAYQDRAVGGLHNQQQGLAGTLKAQLVEDLLGLDARANISRRAASAFGPLLLQDNRGFAADNGNEVRTASVSPYLTHRFGNVATAQLRYTRDRMASDNGGLGDSDGDTLGFTLDSGAAFQQLGWNLALVHAEQDNSRAGKSSNEMASLSLRYRVTPTLNATASGGHDQYDYQALGGENGGASWSLGLDWHPSARTSVTASAGRRYYGDSYALDAQHRSRASVWTIKYSDAVTTTRQQFLLPSTVDTAAMLDRLFSAAIADPAARRQAVEAYILATGLPPTLANSINYFSNRYMLQKQLQAAAAFNSARLTLVTTLTHMRRTSLSTSEVDGGLLGDSSSALNDNTRQSAASAMLNWRLGARSALNLGADYTRIASLSVVRTDYQRNLRLVLSHTLQRSLRANLELRRVNRTGVLAYTEHAIAAALTKTF